MTLVAKGWGTALQVSQGTTWVKQRGATAVRADGVMRSA